MRQLTPEILAEIAGSSRYNAELYFPHLEAEMSYWGITSQEQVAGFTCTITVESNRLQSVEESLYYKDPARIAALYMRVFDQNKNRKVDPQEVELAKTYVRNHGALSELLYKGYHGRGLIQLTWLENYQLASNELGYDYVSDPSLVCRPEHAAKTACWFWVTRGCNDVAHDPTAFTRIVNPALMHLKERTEIYHNALELLA